MPQVPVPMAVSNNKIKVLKRKAYGYRDDEYFKLLLLGLHDTTVKELAKNDRGISYQLEKRKNPINLLFCQRLTLFNNGRKDISRKK
jgi:hypothetical protein